MCAFFDKGIKKDVCITEILNESLKKMLRELNSVDSGARCEFEWMKSPIILEF